MVDDWSEEVRPVSDLVTEDFKKQSIGIACDFTGNVTQVRTAVFPSDRVMRGILDEGITDAMLFLHHAATWDIRRTPVFIPMDKEMLGKFKDRKISVFVHHVPLDNFGEYSTSSTLAEGLGLKLEKAFGKEYGAVYGVIGSGKMRDVRNLKESLAGFVGHNASLYDYGDPAINAGWVAVAAGGANTVPVLKEVVAEGANVLVTGISVLNDYSRAAHDFARQNRISILGGTHYSTEAPACRAMCRYFSGLGLPAQFVPDEPVMEDL
jgi:putative NIF3 family GTP cyclohydrolase 1 type 2